jgi:uncharacterized cupredoxin-like copper-binding protein
MKRGFLLIALGLIAILALAGCGGGAAAGTTGGSGQSVNVKLSEMKFDPDSLTAKAGQPITLNVQNAGTVAHDFSIRGTSPEVSVTVDAGKTATKTFTIDKAGTYEVYCNQPGHEAAGMKATLTVQ